jgi:rhamnulokinase
MNVPYDALFRGLEAEHAASALIYPDDSRFFAPSSMLSAIAAQMRETGQNAPDDPVALTKIILDSLALRCASVIRTIERLTGDTIRRIHIVGGGSQNSYLNQATATASSLPIVAGPIEATATGNILVQAISAGCFAGLEEARRYVATHTPLRRFSPQPSRSWEDAARRYAAIEARYAGKPQKS